MVGNEQGPRKVASLAGELEIHAFRNVLLVCWLSSATMGGVGAVKRARARFTSQHPDGMSIIHLLLADSRPPDGETRASLVDMMRNYSAHVACIAVVTLGGGFGASALQSRVTGMRLEAPAAVKLRFQSTIDEVLTWLPDEHEAVTGQKLERPELSRWLHERADMMLGPTARHG